MTDATIQVDMCECLPRIRQITLEREARYIRDPEAAAPLGPQSTVEVQVTSIGELNEQARSLKSGREWIISEPAHVGGLANAPTPLEYLLSGVLGCFAAVFAFYASKYEVDFHAFDVKGVARMDVRGHMMEDAPPAGFRSVDIAVTVKSDAPEDKLQHVLDLAMAGCPGIDTLRSPVELRPSLTVQR